MSTANHRRLYVIAAQVQKPIGPGQAAAVLSGQAEPAAYRRVYVDPGDRFTGPYVPPRRCRVLIWCRWPKRRERTGPRNVLVEYVDGSRAVIPFSRRLRRAAR